MVLFNGNQQTKQSPWETHNHLLVAGRPNHISNWGSQDELPLNSLQPHLWGFWSAHCARMQSTSATVAVILQSMLVPGNLFTYLIGISHVTQGYFPYMTAASTTMGRKRAVPHGNPRSSIGKWQPLIHTVREESIISWTCFTRSATVKGFEVIMLC